jgi:glycosyltransferase involved in cell wall biosynthesis
VGAALGKNHHCRDVRMSVIKAHERLVDLHIIHSIGSLRKSLGGPTRTATALCAELGRLGVAVDLFSQAGPTDGHDDGDVIPAADLVRTTLVKGYHLHWLRMSYAPSLGVSLRECGQLNKHSVFHDHGLWLPNNHTIASVARQTSIPLIISPRGMLEPWALTYRAWKKRLAWHLYQKRDLNLAALLHATSEREAENFRRLGLRKPVAVITNGTELPEWRDLTYPKGTVRKILFLSRIHPVKGLLNLVQAWKVLRPKGWKMVIAGPDEGGHRQIVQSAIYQAGLQDDFELTGPVDGAEKEALYRSADVFVLPTFTENFGLVIAEALACGIPVITTKGAPWEGLLTHRCGWWIDIGVDPLVAALREATNLPPDTLHEMGQRGRVYVEQNFGWPGIAEQMLSVYRWVLGQGEKPDCVLTD